MVAMAADRSKNEPKLFGSEENIKDEDMSLEPMNRNGLGNADVLRLNEELPMMLSSESPLSLSLSSSSLLLFLPLPLVRLGEYFCPRFARFEPTMGPALSVVSAVMVNVGEG